MRWKGFQTRCHHIFKNNTGLLLIALSQAFGSMMSLFVKKLNSVDPPVPMLELICIRMIITWMCCVSYMSLTKIPDPILGPKGIRLLLAFRGVCGFTGLFGSYYSLQYLSLSDATVLQFLAPMCTAIVGAIVLKEEFKRSQALASLCSLVGVVLIARPTFLFGGKSSPTAPDSHPVLDGRGVVTLLIPMFGVLGATGAYTSIRAMGKRAHPMHSIVAFSTQCVITSTVAMLLVRPHVVLPNRVEWILMLLAIGLCGFMGQMLMTMGLQRETAGRGTMAVYVQARIIFATFNDFVFFHSTPPALSILGTVIIMSSAIYVALSKEDVGARKRHGSVDSTSGDPAEEGLLANEEAEDAEALKTMEDGRLSTSEIHDSA
ncbi:integral membrane protein DUF6 [Laetiporus sulphureus 93-53]|uniref:Integral membrane protein DUF6 n=1 Tax=Laetiporus sulphureus 93-53 TaxID=1314785 RepID=A0A165CLK4_9APHY|nr:integral membrane protein DUF6 [Laetiporus sulphureus 93-53]KZT03028.1 integral membrane protein DUF6 [Laetiporus sulphureus 93-53]